MIDNYLKAKTDAQIEKAVKKLTEQDFAELVKYYEGRSEEEQVTFIDTIAEVMDGDFDREYEDFGLVALKSASPVIRANSFRLMLYCQKESTAEAIMDAVRHDPDESVRVAGLFMLQTFVLEIEDGEPTPFNKEELYALLEEMLRSPEKNIRREALTSFAYTDLPVTHTHIRELLDSPDPVDRAAAITAAGHSLNERWEKDVVSLMGDDNYDVAFAAIGAAGELETAKALPFLYGQISKFMSLTSEMFAQVCHALAAIPDYHTVQVFDLIEEILGDKADDETVEMLDDAFTQLEDALNFRETMKEKAGKKLKTLGPVFAQALEQAADKCYEALEKLLPRDPMNDDENEDECCCGHDHDHEHEHQHTLEDDLAEIMHGSYHIIDDLEAYEKAAEEDDEDDVDIEGAEA